MKVKVQRRPIVIDCYCTYVLKGGDYHPELVQTQDCENPKCVGEITPSEEEEQQV